MIELIEVLFQPVSICLLFFCRAGTDLRKCSDLYGISFIWKYKETATAATDTIEENEKKRKMEIELCKAADAVVAVGSRLQQKYSRSLPNVKVEIITPGILDKFSSESTQHASVMSRTLNALKMKFHVFMKKFNVFMFGRATFEDFTLKERRTNQVSHNASLPTILSTCGRLIVLCEFVLCELRNLYFAN